MKKDGIHLVLITGLALALGFSIASTPAIGYPTAAISYGANPLWALTRLLFVTQEPVDDERLHVVVRVGDHAAGDVEGTIPDLLAEGRRSDLGGWSGGGLAGIGRFVLCLVGATQQEK